MPIPRLIVPIEEDNLLRILWDDDSLSDYPFVYLRGWCPCAACQGHSVERRFIKVNDPRLTRVSMVGNYALTPHWADGHETGVYSFEYLRDLSVQLENENAAKG